MTITEFLLARIEEDEAAARQAIQAERPGVHWQWKHAERDRLAALTGEYEVVSLRTVETFPTRHVGPLPAFVVGQTEVEEPEQAGALRHIARWDPARVLAECEAKRRIMELGECTACQVEYQPCDHRNETLRALATVYAEHEAFQPEWQVSDR